MNYPNEINIDRNSQIYIDIENFEDYEYTNCIAFEMAIRNNEVLTGIIEILILEEVITDVEPTEIYFEKDIMDRLFKENNFKNTNDFLWYIHNFFLSRKYCINSDVIDYFKKYPYNISLLLKNSKYNPDKITKYEYKPNFISQLDMKCYYTYNSFNSSTVYCYDDHDIEKRYFNSKAEHFIIQKLSRPRLKEETILNTNVHILDVNLNLPLEEIQSYIKEIYEAFNSTKKKEFPYVLSSFDLINSMHNDKLSPLNEYLLWKKNTYYNHFKVPKISLEDLFNGLDLTKLNSPRYELTENVSNRLSKQDWADCFFIYDYYTKNNNYSGNDKAKILQEYFDSFYFVKVQSTSNKNIFKKIKLEDYFKYPHLYIKKGIKYKSYYSISTIKSRYNLMKELIENARYTYFIRG